MNVTRLIFPLIIIGMIGCKKKENQETIFIPTTLPVDPPIVVDSAFIDNKTPQNIQPYLLDANGQPLKKAVTADAPNGYALVFSDEFNASAVNPLKWNIEVSPKSRDPRPDKGIGSWFFKADQIEVDGSALLLKATKLNASTMYCGALTSTNKYEPRFGYMEVRIDNADIEKAVHTAFWLQGQNQGQVDGTGNDGCEVDIFESAFTKGSHTQSTLHWDGYGASTKAWTKHWDNAGTYGEDIHTGYHIIALEWTATSLRFYYDGKRMFDYTGVGLPLVKEYLLLSVGASFGDGEFTSRPVGLLTQAKVDWIRVYTKK